MTRALAVTLALAIGVARAEGEAPQCVLAEPAPETGASLRWNESPGLWVSDPQTEKVAARIKALEERVVAAEIAAAKAGAPDMKLRVPTYVWVGAAVLLGAGAGFGASYLLRDSPAPATATTTPAP